MSLLIATRNRGKFAEIAEALPAVAGHFAEQRSLAVHDLVVAQRQDEVLGERVEQAEGELIVMM